MISTSGHLIPKFPEVRFHRTRIFKKEIKKEFEIEANDERNVSINRIAKSFAFDIMTVLFSATITIMALIGEISVGSFFMFFAIYVITQIAYIYKLRKLHKTM